MNDADMNDAIDVPESGPIASLKTAADVQPTEMQLIRELAIDARVSVEKLAAHDGAPRNAQRPATRKSSSPPRFVLRQWRCRGSSNGAASTWESRAKFRLPTMRTWTSLYVRWRRNSASRGRSYRNRAIAAY